MAELQFPNLLASFQQGQARGEQRRVNRLTGQALQAAPEQRNGLLTQIGYTDPNAAAGLQDRFQSQDDDHAKKLGGAARYMISAIESQNPAQIQGAWQAVAPMLQRLTGKPTPPLWSDDMKPALYEAYARVGGDNALGAAPTGFREFQMTTAAAGLQPGTPEYQRAARIALGSEGRASNAGFGFEMVEGADGRKRMGRKNPRTGAFEVYNEQTGEFEQLGGAPVAQGGALAGQGPTAMRVNIDGIPPAQQQRMAQTAAFMRQAGYPDAEIDAWIGSQPRFERPSNAGLAVGRTPEEEAAAKTSAEEQAKLALLRQRGDIEADNAGLVVTAQKRAGAQAEVDATAGKRNRDADATLALLDEAERLLPDATGSRVGAAVDTAAGVVGQSTRGAEATAALNLIAAGLVQKVPRFEGPQSNIDVQFYKDAAGDLANPNLPVGRRMAALQQMRRLQQQYATPQGQPDRPPSNAIQPANADRESRARQLLDEARAAIGAGKDPALVKKRLIDLGFPNTAGRL